jgi:hypothetical protein
MTFDIHVNSLDELTDTKKSPNEYEKRFFSILQLLVNEPVQLKFPKPVYVEKDASGEEIIVYNSSRMEIGKFYEIDYKGEKWALVKNEKTVEFKKFYPAEK